MKNLVYKRKGVFHYRNGKPLNQKVLHESCKRVTGKQILQKVAEKFQSYHKRKVVSVRDETIYSKNSKTVVFWGVWNYHNTNSELFKLSPYNININ